MEKNCSTKIQFIIYLEIFICLIIEFLKSIFPLFMYPNIVLDILVFILCYLLIKQSRVDSCSVDVLEAVECIFVLYVLVITLNKQYQVYRCFLQFRYIWFGIITSIAVRKKATTHFGEKLIYSIYIAQIINFFLVIVQYVFKMGDVDHVNGIFGWKEYNNAMQGMFCLIVAIIGAVSSMYSEKHRMRFYSMIIMSNVICALSEIKAFFVLFVFSIVLTIFISFERKKMLFKMIIASLFSISISMILLWYCMPDNMYAMTGIDEWVEYENYGTNYIGNGIGRINQLQYVRDKEFSGRWECSIFGNGLGDDIEYIPYDLGKLYAISGGGGLLLIGVMICLNIKECIKDIKRKDNKISFILNVMFGITLIIWNTVLSRMIILWSVFLGLHYFEKHSNQR